MRYYCVLQHKMFFEFVLIRNVIGINLKDNLRCCYFTLIWSIWVYDTTVNAGAKAFIATLVITVQECGALYQKIIRDEMCWFEQHAYRKKVVLWLSMRQLPTSDQMMSERSKSMKVLIITYANYTLYIYIYIYLLYFHAAHQVRYIWSTRVAAHKEAIESGVSCCTNEVPFWFFFSYRNYDLGLGFISYPESCHIFLYYTITEWDISPLLYLSYSTLCELIDVFYYSN